MSMAAFLVPALGLLMRTYHKPAEPEEPVVRSSFQVGPVFETGDQTLNTLGRSVGLSYRA